MRIHAATTLQPLHRNGMGAYDSPGSITDVCTRKPNENLATIRDVQALCSVREELVGKPYNLSNSCSRLAND